MRTQSNGKSQISNRWHADIKSTINEYNFVLDGTFDSITRSNKRHKCQFCGSNLRYVAVINGSSLNSSIAGNISYQIGLDCLELVLGSTWSGLGEAQRQIRILKTEAACTVRRDKYALKYRKMIIWLNEVIQLTDDQFLTNMHHVLTTGSTVFSEKMEEAVKNCARQDRYNITKLQEKADRIEEITANIRGLIILIREVDVLDEQDTNKTLDFVHGVLGWVVENGHITNAQSNGLKKVRKRYLKRKEKWGSLHREYEKRCEIPF